MIGTQNKKITNEELKEGFYEAYFFVEDKYPQMKTNSKWNNFGFSDIYISKTAYNSGCRWGTDSQIKKLKTRGGKRIYIGLRGCDLYNSYLRKIDYLSPIGGIQVDRFAGYKTALVHELTHLVQWIEQRSGSEKETTINEIEYLNILSDGCLQHYLVSYEERKRQESEFKEWKNDGFYGGLVSSLNRLKKLRRTPIERD